ncbi:MAG: class I SAM-dependent methyltransferase [Anaerolineales bacterium]|nr:MAG: class I SAM-dependent methyltransferase [Anaerolineales bacterium]
MGGTNPVDLSLDNQLSYSLRRQHVDEFLARQLGSLSDGCRLLDLGGVKQGQRGYGQRVSGRLQVTVANLVSDKGLDLKADAARLPLAAGSYEAVLCSEVLEHVNNPEPVLQEMVRVLQPGGIALITVPFMFRQHADPADYGRYTEWFWAENLQRMGFSEYAIEKQGLFGSLLADMLRHWWQQGVIEGRGPLPRVQRWLLPRLMASTRRRALRFDANQRTHPVWSSYVGGFGIVTRKPR